MFGSTTLNIIISLVFIYLLYSLLITIIGEMVANWLGIRARVLRKAIEKMLNDGYEEKANGFFAKIAHALNEFFLKENKHFKDSLAGHFYNQPSIKYLTRGHKKSALSFRQTKPSYLSGDNFADTLAQILRSKGNGTTDIEKIKFSFKYNTLHIEQETLTQFKNILHDSAEDLEAFKTKLETWFDETMDRANGWYKKKMQLILFWLGFIVAAFFNVDTIKIVSVLSTDKDALNQTVQLAVAGVDTTSNISKAFQLTQQKDRPDNTILKKALTDVSTEQKNTSKILGLGWEGTKYETFTIPYVNCKINYYYEAFGQIFDPREKTFWGLVMTALALSLGAPFWFDLLKKLVSLRSAGVKPEEKDDAPASDAVVVQNIQPAAAPAPAIAAVLPALSDAEQLLMDFTKKLRNIPGFVGVGLQPLANNINGVLTVHVSNPALKTILAGIHGAVQKLPNGFSLPVNYLVQAPVKTQTTAQMGGGISNSVSASRHGTLSCFMTKKDSDKTYLLSCWHVLKDNENWDVKPVSKDIVDATKKSIATITDGCLTDTLDIGLAECTDASIVNNTGLQVKSQFRLVTAYDSLMNTNVVLYGKVCKYQKAQIFHHQINTSINYSNQDHFMYDLFSVTIISGGTYNSPTQPGDSGAIVLDANTGVPLGIIIGGNNEFSYGVKFSNAFSANSLYSNYSFKI